jgi:hypothetical protein
VILAPTDDATGDAFDKYWADFDDTYLVDRQGQLRYFFSAKTMPFDESENRDRIDDWVRTLLAEPEP